MSKQKIAKERWNKMSKGDIPVGDVAKDMAMMHQFYGVDVAVEKMDKEKLKAFLKFRIDFLREELDETEKAYNEDDAEEVVDGLIDLVVVAVGTLDLFGVDFKKAWREVLKANMDKFVGQKTERPNPLGLPDLCKPKDWKNPSHKGNHGKL